MRNSIFTSWLNRLCGGEIVIRVFDLTFCTRHFHGVWLYVVLQVEAGRHSLVVCRVTG